MSASWKSCLVIFSYFFFYTGDKREQVVDKVLHAQVITIIGKACTLTAIKIIYYFMIEY